MRREIDRREFLERATCVGLAAGLAAGAAGEMSCGATAGGAGPLVDTHVYVGAWPFRYVGDADGAETLAKLRAREIETWVGSLEGVWHKDLAAVNRRVAAACAQDAMGRLVPFGAINPLLPEWEDDMRRCHDEHGMRGVRLHPGFHGYALDDERVRKLLEMAASRRLLVQVVLRLDGGPYGALGAGPQPVGLEPLVEAVRGVEGVRVLAVGGGGRPQDEAVRTLAESGRVWFDFGGAPRGPALADWLSAMPRERVTFGSATPLGSVDEASARLEASGLEATALEAVRRDNALAALGGEG